MAQNKQSGVEGMITVWYQDPACLVVSMYIYSIVDVEDLACWVG
jgi:hypothetical protein